MKLHEAIAKAAQDADLTDTEIGAAVGVAAGSVSDWRKGHKIPRGDRLIALTRILPGLAQMIGLAA